MRFLVKVSLPVEAGNAAAKDGFKAIQSILEQQKPEAAYFVPIRKRWNRNPKPKQEARFHEFRTAGTLTFSGRPGDSGLDC